MKIILFDLFGTLIEKEEYHYDIALKWLAHTYFNDKFLELKELSKIFKNEYLKDRKISNKETSFFDQLTFFENKLNIKILDDFEFVELRFIYIFRREKLVDGAFKILEYLSQHDYKIFILSNSIFTGKNLNIYLNNFGIGKYIETVFSSSDIGYRKPSEEVFAYIKEVLNIENPKKVYFIGDSLEKDYKGAENTGFTPILIGVNQKVSGLFFNDLLCLLNYFKNYLR